MPLSITIVKGPIGERGLVVAQVKRMEVESKEGRKAQAGQLISSETSVLNSRF